MRMREVLFLIFICCVSKSTTAATDHASCPRLANEISCKTDAVIKRICPGSCSQLLNSTTLLPVLTTTTQKPDHATCPYRVNVLTCEYTRWVKPLCPSACEAIVLNSKDAPTRFTTDHVNCYLLARKSTCERNFRVQLLCPVSCGELLNVPSTQAPTVSITQKQKPDHATCPNRVNAVTCEYTKWVKPLCPSACEVAVLSATDAPTRFTTDHVNCHFLVKKSTCETNFKVQLLCPVSCGVLLDAPSTASTTPPTGRMTRKQGSANADQTLCRTYKLNRKICSSPDIKKQCSATCSQYEPPQVPTTTSMTGLPPGYKDGRYCHLLADSKTCQLPDLITYCKIACGKHKATTPTKPADTITTPATQPVVATTILKQTPIVITEPWTTEEIQTSLVPTETIFTTPKQSCHDMPHQTKLCPSVTRDFKCHVTQVSPTVSSNGTKTMDICFKCTGDMTAKSCHFCSWMKGPTCRGQAREDMAATCGKRCRTCKPTVVQFAWASYPCQQVFQTIVTHFGTAATIPSSIFRKIFDPAFRDQVCNTPRTGDWTTQVSLP